MSPDVTYPLRCPRCAWFTTTVTLGGFVTICRCDACRWWMEVK